MFSTYNSTEIDKVTPTYGGKSVFYVHLSSKIESLNKIIDQKCPIEEMMLFDFSKR